MPHADRLERARKLGLCVECCAKPTFEDYTHCKRCLATKKLYWRKAKEARNLRRRVRAAHKRALRAWIEAGDLTVTPPEPPEYVEPRWWYVNRVQKWHRRPGKPKKPYKYTPRPLPNAEKVC